MRPLPSKIAAAFDERDFLTTTDLTSLLGFSRTRLWRHIENGVLPFHDFSSGGRYRRPMFSRSDIETYLHRTASSVREPLRLKARQKDAR